MRHGVILTVPIHGHLHPLRGLIQSLVSRGERLTVFATRPFQAQLEDAGAEFRPYPPGFDDFQAQLQSTDSRMRSKLILAERTLAELPSLLQAVQALAPDYLLRDCMSWWGRQLGRILELPTIAYYPIFVVEPGHTPVPRSLIRQKLRDTVTHLPDVLTLAWRAQRMVRAVGGIRLSPRDLLPLPEELNIVFTTRAFQPGGDTLDARFQFIGPSVPTRSDAPPLSEAFLSERELIYVSLGTLNGAAGTGRGEHAFRVCADAFGNSPRRVLMAVGPQHNPSALMGVMPENVSLKPYVLQLQVFQHAKLFITHGGMNSVTEAIMAGVPMIVVPQASEQPLIAQQVKAFGMGEVIEPEALSVTRLRAVAEQILSNPGYAARTRSMGERFKAAGGPELGADILLRHLASVCA